MVGRGIGVREGGEGGGRGMVEARGGGGEWRGGRTGGDRWPKEGGGGTTAPQTRRQDGPAFADRIVGTAPRGDQSFRQGHRLEQSAQGGPVNHPGAHKVVKRR